MFFSQKLRSQSSIQVKDHTTKGCQIQRLKKRLTSQPPSSRSAWAAWLDVRHERTLQFWHIELPANLQKEWKTSNQFQNFRCPPPPTLFRCPSLYASCLCDKSIKENQRRRRRRLPPLPCSCWSVQRCGCCLQWMPSCMLDTDMSTGNSSSLKVVETNFLRVVNFCASRSSEFWIRPSSSRFLILRTCSLYFCLVRSHPWKMATRNFLLVFSHRLGPAVKIAVKELLRIRYQPGRPANEAYYDASWTSRIYVTPRVHYTSHCTCKKGALYDVSAWDPRSITVRARYYEWRT